MHPLSARFNTEETERIIALRRRFKDGLPYLDHDLDERRLEFARWLVECGRLREGLPSEGSTAYDAQSLAGITQEATR